MLPQFVALRDFRHARAQGLQIPGVDLAIAGSTAVSKIERRHSKNILIRDFEFS